MKTAFKTYFSAGDNYPDREGYRHVKFFMSFLHQVDAPLVASLVFQSTFLQLRNRFVIRIQQPWILSNELLKLVPVLHSVLDFEVSV